jgi:hypothetical protein
MLSIPIGLNKKGINFHQNVKQSGLFFVKISSGHKLWQIFMKTYIFAIVFHIIDDIGN